MWPLQDHLTRLQVELWPPSRLVGHCVERPIGRRKLHERRLTVLFRHDVLQTHHRDSHTKIYHTQQHDAQYARVDNRTVLTFPTHPCHEPRRSRPPWWSLASRFSIRRLEMATTASSDELQRLREAIESLTDQRLKVS